MKFKVGDVVRVKQCHGDTPSWYIGIECTIIRVNPMDQKNTYQTDYHGMWGCDDCFELKRPPEYPREELGEWELCPWRPKEYERVAP